MRIARGDEQYFARSNVPSARLLASQGSNARCYRCVATRYTAYSLVHEVYGSTEINRPQGWTPSDRDGTYDSGSLPSSAHGWSGHEAAPRISDVYQVGAIDDSVRRYHITQSTPPAIWQVSIESDDQSVLRRWFVTGNSNHGSDHGTFQGVKLCDANDGALPSVLTRPLQGSKNVSWPLAWIT